MWNYFYIQKQIHVKSLNLVLYARVIAGSDTSRFVTLSSFTNVASMQQKEAPSDLFSSRTLVMAGRNLSNWTNPEWSSSTWRKQTHSDCFALCTKIARFYSGSKKQPRLQRRCFWPCRWNREGLAERGSSPGSRWLCWSRCKTDKCFILICP